MPRLFTGLEIPNDVAMTLASLAGDCRTCRRDLGLARDDARHRGSGRARNLAGELSDCAKHPLAMSEGHAKLFQVSLAQEAQCVDVNVVLGEDLHILFEGQLLQPSRN